MALYSVLTWDVTVWKICIIASLTASVNATINASVKRALLIHGFSTVSPLVAIKGKGEAFSRSTEVLQPWPLLGIFALALLKFV